MGCGCGSGEITGPSGGNDGGGGPLGRLTGSPGGVVTYVVNDEVFRLAFDQTEPENVTDRGRPLRLSTALNPLKPLARKGPSRLPLPSHVATNAQAEPAVTVTARARIHVAPPGLCPRSMFRRGSRGHRWSVVRERSEDCLPRHTRKPDRVGRAEVRAFWEVPSLPPASRPPRSLLWGSFGFFWHFSISDLGLRWVC